MYLTIEDFSRDAFACGTYFYSDKSLLPDRIEAAFKIYSKVSRGTRIGDFQNNPIDFGITIVGRLSLRTEDGQWIPSDPSFPSIDQIMKENLTVANEEDGVTGSILDSGLWSLLANDAWLLGSIHAITEFHYASPLSWTNLWSEKDGRMSVTAREAIGIMSFGYTIRRPYPQMEAVAACTDKTKAAEASLLNYRDEVLKYQTKDAMIGFFNSLPDVVKM